MPARTSRLSAAHDLHQLDPVRRPDWRYQRARELVAQKRRPCWCPVRDDAAVRLMVSLLQRLRRGNESGHEELPAELAALMQALAIYEGPDPEFRVRLECEILAGQSDDEIAEVLGISAACVTAYERLFFDVRERLDCVGWIYSYAVNGKGSTAAQRELKSIAYYLGPAALHGPPGSNARDYWEAIKRIAQFMASLEHEFTPLQVLQLHQEIAAEQTANKALEAFTATVADAARELVAATGPNVGEERQPDAEPARLRIVA